MLNTTYFRLLAGEPGPWDSEMMCKFAEGEGLPDIQENQHRRGRRSAILVNGEGGWYVRSSSGLDSPQILCGYHRTSGSKTTAIAFDIDWANQDPDNREFIATARDLS